MIHNIMKVLALIAVLSAILLAIVIGDYWTAAGFGLIFSALSSVEQIMTDIKEMFFHAYDTRKTSVDKERP